ncbi:uncharacterized protein BDR25DRAFT_265753 [Lindgomyces ingoldianus]|uniref:Uncharacterized protein n=1 Tax=Lindgomyces ingoldianus TaxID=673940 RepID=A0ACB6QMC0_9PLEO|nr:uncharacterized protein BDR25DRAFT_265753 [Lindgomyces ingoldianus]KAF2468133.1 hypothetical protein BDR25DRAFT_265753 [Lindgomyces ingoldianus]
MTPKERESWIARYANKYHAWHTTTLNGKKVYQRPLGLVEWSFDTDGVEYGGRADMNALLALEIRHSLSKEDYRRRIALAWANLRLQHVMLQSKVYEDKETGRRNFVVELHGSQEDVVEEALRSIVWVEDSYPSVDAYELHRHSLNVGRIIDPSLCLSRLHVLPLDPLPNGNFLCRFLVVMAHQISDGLSAYNWFRHFFHILNMPAAETEREIKFFRSAENIASRLPPAQEDLYPPISGNKARQRWFWAVLRVLRHVRKTLPRTFINPLRREERLLEAVSFPPTFSKVFDYSADHKPPMNSFHCVTSLSKPASQRLIDICRSINVSVGAGCFALAGISMMEMEERLHPSTSNAERRPFSASFPLNPRTFFGYTAPADSCMLSFSDGIVLPFLPSSFPMESRFRLIASQANRQLRVYQKRLKSAEVNISLEPYSPGRLLANGYLFQIERGSYPANIGQFGATCGVSSVGSTASFFRPGLYGLSDVGAVRGKDFAADFRSLKMCVRARENEFLVGSSTDHDGTVSFSVSYDGNAISEEAAEAWAEKIRSLLEVGERPRL